MKVLKVLSVAFYAISIMVLVWFFASWVDIVTNNLSPNPFYQEWNAFVVGSEWNKGNITWEK